MTAEDVEVFTGFLKKNFFTKFKDRWQKARRIKTRFLDLNENWLKNVYKVCKYTANNEAPSCSNMVKRGRPAKAFEDCQPRTKRTKVQDFCENTSMVLISSAAKKSECLDKSIKAFTPEKALGLILDASLSKHQYEVLRSSAREIGFDIYPSYHQVLEAKKKCYPANVQVQESCSKVSLQQLLDHTVTRILMTKTENEVTELPNELQMFSKWGCDGSSGHSEYHQKFTDPNDSDKYMFLTSLVPLTLTERNNMSTMCWRNTEPSSTRFCRPLKFEFIQETAEVINSEVSRVNDEIKNLRNTVVELHSRNFNISHTLKLTMIDGKVATTISGSSSMAVCFICGAKPTEMNNLDAVILRKCSEEAVAFGISPLHARIKLMECILHISYRLSFKKWRTDSYTKIEMAANKAEIGKRLKLTLGINVDAVKQGMGTTNDGNTARRFFENPAKTADVIGIKEELIHRFKIILAAINCNAAVDTSKFHIYCMDTAKLFVDLYGWYYMPVTVHKILVHGSKIIAEAILPIGMLSEEAQEARNKDYRAYRLHHSRRIGRVATNEDVMHNLLLSSDPFINRFRSKLQIKKLEYDNDVKKLLKDYA
ncbi:uncharacterized protein LOC131994136 isoform X2 [Stomoxys calcitrans]|nr:uncharacterized protein LOC131994136 isoform X2 [Stomoxys calcitrans]XP_059216469.1 uncharacterized protein LOC131994136 isoform X2 [Stomoxys calcitrans]